MSSVVKTFQPSGILDGISGNQLRKEIISAIETVVEIVKKKHQKKTNKKNAGLGTLLAAVKTVKTTESKIFICSVNKQVKMIFEMTKMERIFQIFNDRDDFKTAILSPECRFFEHH